MPVQIWGWLTMQSQLSIAAGILSALAALLFMVNAVRLSAIDVRSHRLPNRILWPWFLSAVVLLGAAALLAGDPAMLLRTLLGGVVLCAGYLVLHLIAPAGMGLGDVKLAAVLGLYLGFVSYSHLLMATALAFILGALWSSVLLLARRATLRSSVAFGPFMLLGAAFSLAVSA
ncbi:prepilin peptidase [Paeniglutamicibacter sp. R2-26]|uniref:prepilin peptidase n=1 Tax=Paeniglutamicibacter sp. R2-26 TaxID=3144417 RepID=UPI003EE5153D